MFLSPGAGLIVEQVQLRDEIVHMTVRREAPGAHCPRCGTWSEAFHSGYERNLGDLPLAGRQAVVDLRVRRFRCYHLACPRKTFVEQAPELAERYAHRTLRLRSVLGGIGIALGGRPGSRQCTRLEMPISRTTLLRMVRALREPRVLGVDEFAFLCNTGKTDGCFGESRTRKTADAVRPKRHCGIGIGATKKSFRSSD